jgi:hypothetical protein
LAKVCPTHSANPVMTNLCLAQLMRKGGTSQHQEALPSAEKPSIVKGREGHGSSEACQMKAYPH